MLRSCLYVIMVLMTKTRERASALRKRIMELAANMSSVVEPLLEPRELFKGGVCLSHRRCGKRGCRCAHGQRHAAWIAAGEIGGRRTTRSLPAEKRQRLRKMAGQYKKFRKARTELRKKMRELTETIRALEEELRVDPFASEAVSRRRR